MQSYHDIIFKNCGDHISDDVLTAIGVVFCANLPAEYALFLERVNGGEPDKNEITVNNTIMNIIHFFGITAKNRMNLLGGLIYRQEYPKRMIPIAETSEYDLIVMSLQSKDRGKVYHWDARYESEITDPENVGSDNLTLLANSFDEFLGMLYKDDAIS